MATNHFALYCAVSNDKTHYKIGMTQQTKRAREQKNFAIVMYADFNGIETDRTLLFAMEDFIRSYMSDYYERDYQTDDYYYVKEYDIEDFGERFLCGINQLIKKMREKRPRIQAYIQDYTDEVESRLKSNNALEGLTLSEYLAKYF